MFCVYGFSLVYCDYIKLSFLVGKIVFIFGRGFKVIELCLFNFFINWMLVCCYVFVNFLEFMVLIF